DIFGDYKNQIIPFFAIAAVNFVLYTFSQFGGKTESEDLILMINIATSGLFSATHSSFSSIFAFSDASSYPQFILPRGILDLFTEGKNNEEEEKKDEG
ncbi:12531_t:CDS:2, partial [Gigaspora rosea]